MILFSDWAVFVDDVMRLSAAALLGGAIGLERELNGHFAGLRTHMMVAIGCAVFVVAGLAIAGDERQEAVTRVIQGVAAGIGFLGAGTILKIDEQQKIKGLTTASSIWLAAALGTVAGLAEYGLAAAAACVALLVLTALRPVEKTIARHFGEPRQKNRMDTPQDTDVT
jgi:putative Mg2+ transporter-C (MgtC) family protein